MDREDVVRATIDEIAGTWIMEPSGESMSSSAPRRLTADELVGIGRRWDQSWLRASLVVNGPQMIVRAAIEDIIHLLGHIEAVERTLDEVRAHCERVVGSEEHEEYGFAAFDVLDILKAAVPEE